MYAVVIFCMCKGSLFLHVYFYERMYVCYMYENTFSMYCIIFKIDCHFYKTGNSSCFINKSNKLLIYYSKSEL